MNPKQYTYRVLYTILLVSTGLLILNLLVDPLDIYRWYKHPGINQFKPKYSSYARLAKPMQIERYGYEWIALGSSRVLNGIPASGFESPIPETKRFNAGLSGATLTLVSELFQHAVAVSEVKEVVISTDFFMFNAYTQGRFTTPVATLGETSLQKLQRHANDAIETLFSPQIASASIYTLRHQSAKYNKYLSNGLSINQRKIDELMQQGYREEFEHFEDGNMLFSVTPCRDNRFSYTTKDVDTLQVFRAMLELAAEKHIRVRLFISPVHARLQEALAAIDLWPHQQQWKVDVTQVVAEVNSRYPGSDIELWDFSGYNAFTSEAFPEQRGVPMQWYMDSSHFRDTLGLLIIKTMQSGDTSLYPAVKLTPENIQQHNRQVDQDQAAYRATHQAQYQNIAERAERLSAQRRAHGWDCSAL